MTTPTATPSSARQIAAQRRMIATETAAERMWIGIVREACAKAAQCPVGSLGYDKASAQANYGEGCAIAARQKIERAERQIAALAAKAVPA